MVKIYGIKLPDEDVFSSLQISMARYLPGEIREKADQYRNSLAYRRFVTGELMTRAILHRVFRLDLRSMKFGYGAKGKPYLTDHPGIHFNRSHSGQWVVCAFSNKAVGVDVERIRKINPALANRFFSDEEKDRLFSLAGDAYLNYFFDLWTLKESYLKLLGSGLTKPLSSFTVRFVDDNIQIIEDDQPVEVFLKQFTPDSEHKLSVCSREEIIAREMEQLKTEELLEMID
jgi:4'-phosphopantetheinyl transferase